MLLIAICVDSADASERRPALLGDHGQYLLSLEALRFSAPLASRDDAAVTGEGIESSLIILEGEEWQALVGKLMADPYASGGVWSQIDLYELRSMPKKSDDGFFVDMTKDARWYLRLSTTVPSGTDVFEIAYRDRWKDENSVVVFPDILTGGGSKGWRGLQFLSAPSMENALRTQATQAAKKELVSSSVFAVPVAAGSWTKR